MCVRGQFVLKCPLVIHFFFDEHDSGSSLPETDEDFAGSRSPAVIPPNGGFLIGNDCAGCSCGTHCKGTESSVINILSSIYQNI